jgi:hypothetical protein
MGTRCELTFSGDQAAPIACDDFVTHHSPMRRIPDMESLGLSYGSFMGRRIGLVMPSFAVASKSIKN